MDARKILDRLKGEADRARTSLYLSKSIMDEFKEACGEIAPSRVMEDLMKDFIESHNLQRKADKMVAEYKEELKRKN